MSYNPETKKGNKPKKKTQHQAETISSLVSLYEIRTDLALLKQKLDQLINNDLKHIETDVSMLRKWGLGFFMAILLSVLSLHLERVVI